MLKIFTVAGVMGAALLSAGSAGAQFYDPYGRPPPPPPRYDYDYDRPPPPRDYGYDRRRGWDDDRPMRPRRFGDACVTSRGTCETRPSPIGAGCGCYFDGFGAKRGIVQ